MNIFSKIALRSMKQNRVRTVVTILGILLSAAMFTAVTTSVSSYLNYFGDYMEYRNGSWSYVLYRMQEDEAAACISDAGVESYAALRQLGFANAEGCANPDKPYFCVEGLEGNTGLLPIHLTEGRMPQNDSELVIASHAISNGEMDIEIGQTLVLQVGKRMSGGMELDNHVGFLGNSSDENGEDAQGEYLTGQQTKTYTVVGICARPSFEDYSAPGYTALTVTDSAMDSEKLSCDLFIKLIEERNTAQIFEEVSKNHAGKINLDYLRARGNSGEMNFNSMLYGLAAILIGIIVFGSVALIYNSFSISINERMKLFGILSSVGATRKQLMKSVLTEGLFLGCIGIPLGIVAGILGMAITFSFVGDKIAGLLFETYPVRFSMQPSIPAILIAVVIAVATILISAYIPMHKAMKTAVVDIIRQSREIRIRGKQVKTSKLTYRLFGFEGTLAAKNFKRNRRKYRATIASLCVSIVLFISASSFCVYLEQAVGVAYEGYGCDVLLAETQDITKPLDSAATQEQILRMEEVQDVRYAVTMLADMNLMVEQTGIEKTIADYYYPPNSYSGAEVYLLPAQLVFIEDEQFFDFAKEQHLQNPEALIYDQMDYYTDRYYTNRAISNLEKANPRLVYVREQEDAYDGMRLEQDGSVNVCFAEGDTENERFVPLEKAAELYEVEGNLVRELPDGIYTGQQGTAILLIYPLSQLDSFVQSYGSGYANAHMESAGVKYSIITDNAKATSEKLRELEHKKEMNHAYYISNFKDSMEEGKTMVLIVNVFSYGFIVLISLIALANVFNTISTNIQLRSREFAMLRSVGMSPKGMHRMMNYECLLYGIKGLMYGLPVSILLTYLIWRATASGVWMKFFVPWYSVAIAVGSVFIVVFATMLYAMNRISKENTIDALKAD